MTSTAALTETITDFSFGKSMLNILPKNKTKCFWDTLSSADQLESIRKDRPVTVGGQTVWVAKGKVQQLWQDFVWPDVKKFLERKAAKIFEPNNGLMIVYDVHIYMSGSLEKFRPTIVSSCVEPKVSICVLKLVKSLLDSRRLGFKYLAVRATVSLKTGDPSEIDPFSQPLNACGVPISVRFGAGGSHKTKAATLGGCLHIDSKPYGLTAAHILFTDLTGSSEEPASVEDTSVECWEVCSDLSDLEVSEHSHSTSLHLSASPALEVGPQEYFWRSDSRKFQFSDHDPLLWDLVIQAHKFENHELDWLLIPLEADDLQFENRVQFKKRDIYIHGVANDVPDDTVILVAGRSGSQLLKASSTLGGIFIPSARKLLRTWSIFHEDDALTHGDSGSWAINEFGEVYGFLVGANETSRVSYLAPMVTTIGAIRGQNPDAEVSFPIRRLESHPEKQEVSVHETESQFQSIVPSYATYTARPMIGRGPKAAAVEPWLDQVQAQSIELTSTEQLYGHSGGDNDRPDNDDVVSDVASDISSDVPIGNDRPDNDDVMSDVASDISFDVPIGSDAGVHRWSATSSMISSVSNQSGDANNDLELASQDEEFEASLTDLRRFMPIIRGTSGDREKIDPRYHKRPDAERFFAVGRVLAYISHETVEEGKDLGNVIYITGSKDGKHILSRIRRLAVIQECDGYCIAVPIETSNSHVLLKNALEKVSKIPVLVYGNDTMLPVVEKDEGTMDNDVIAIDLSGAEKKFENVNRLDSEKPTVIEWEVKVMDIGKVAATSRSAFARYALDTLKKLQLRDNAPSGAPAATEALSHSALPQVEPVLLRGLGETYIYDIEQGEMERMARRIPPPHSSGR